MDKLNNRFNFLESTVISNKHLGILIGRDFWHNWYHDMVNGYNDGDPTKPSTMHKKLINQTPEVRNRRQKQVILAAIRKSLEIMDRQETDIAEFEKRFHGNHGIYFDEKTGKTTIGQGERPNYTFTPYIPPMLDWNPLYGLNRKNPFIN